MMTQKVLFNIEEIRQKCEALSDHEYLKHVKALIPTDWEVIGVRTANIRKLSSEYAKKIKGKNDFGEIINYLDKVFELKNLTLAAVGFEVIRLNSEYLEPSIIPRVKKWIPSVSDWAIADSLAINVTSSLLEKELIKLKDLKFLKDHSNIFGRRIYITSMVLPIRKESADIDLFLSEIEGFVSDKNKYIYKAVSWVLREGTRKHKGRIARFIDQHQTEMHSSVKREVINKIKTGKKNS